MTRDKCCATCVQQETLTQSVPGISRVQMESTPLRHLLQYLENRTKLKDEELRTVQANEVGHVWLQCSHDRAEGSSSSHRSGCRCSRPDSGPRNGLDIFF